MTVLSRIRWLHLSDLHIGKDSLSQRNATASLVASIRAEVGAEKFKFIFLTGDLAYSGKANEYAELERLVLQPLRALPQFSDAEVVSVPGNHDLDCDAAYPIAWANLGPKRQEQFFGPDEAGRRIRAARAEGFKAYSEFTRRQGIVSPDPTQEVALKHDISLPDGRLELVLATTAFFSDKEVPDYQKCPSPVAALRPLLQSPMEARRIVLGHHPISWFHTESGEHLKSLLGESGAIYLNGHEHEVRPLFGRRGLLALGFGAAYQAGLEDEKKDYYRNSYAICEMTDVLHCKMISWDGQYGCWRLDNNLPSDFHETSELLSGGHKLPLPSTRLTDSTARPYGALAAGLQQSLGLDRCVWLATESPKRWTELLAHLGLFSEVQETYTLGSQDASAGYIRFRVKDRRGNHLVHAVSASGVVLTYEQLQALNTEFDTQDYANCFIATLGTIADDATTLATQLKTRKPIEVYERDHILRSLLRKSSPEFRTAIESSDPAEVRQWIVISDSDIGALRQQRSSNAWFEVLDGQGHALDESSEVVRKIRQDLPDLSEVRYRGLAPAVAQSEAQGVSFDRQIYLSASYSYFDDVKYAPLAALGLKFGNASLSEIYVDANADATEGARSDDAVSRAVDELIDSLRLPASQRDQLKAQLKSRYAGDRSSEVGAARQLYQRFNNVIVLGDPGSGKTCFVKNEILAYCRPPLVGGSWYAEHLPIYISLAEAARLVSDSTDLLDVCATLSARRGINLPRSEILRCISSGQAAFFFDGLDEVGSIEKRVKLMGEIGSLIERQASRGNRFVVASRPAAVQPVRVPKELKYLQLKGLSESEMRVLASRVISARLGVGDDPELQRDEVELVEKLIEDTRNSPGIDRIARNPLLLTLLVLIYANSGAPSTKRHLIYTQAIKTLVSVRGREKRDEQLAESDLRIRLGALAVAVFGREIAEIPRRSEVAKVLEPLMTGSEAEDGINRFLQDVAESTGLLKVHVSEADAANDLITFMHYSFLEYYAAAGLLATDYQALLESIVEKARWKDVVTLLFGILSEQSDVTPALKKVIGGGGASQNITKSRLLLALECAAECDVPPVESQKLLVAEINAAVSQGAGRVSGELRSELAVRIAPFLQSGAGARFYQMIEVGLRSAEPIVAASFADLAAALPLDVTLPLEVRTAFTELLKQTDPNTTVVALNAMKRRLELRPEVPPPVVFRSLKGNLVEKHAALTLVQVVPAYYIPCMRPIEDLLNDSNEFVRSSAARCIMYCDQALPSGDRVALQEKVLMEINISEQDEGETLSYVTLDRHRIERMVNEGSSLGRELALRYTPLIKNDPEFVYRTLITCLRTSTVSRHRAASMDALRVAPRAIDLMTIADTDLVCKCAQANERNVRIAAVRLLGDMPDDEQVQIALLTNLRAMGESKDRDSEISEAAKAVAKHSNRNRSLRPHVVGLVKKELPTPGAFGDGGAQSNFASLLYIIESFSGEHDQVLAASLLNLAEDFKTPELIRRSSLRAFGKLAEPNAENAAHFVRLLKRNDVKLNEAVYTALVSFLGECKSQIGYIRRVQGSLNELGACVQLAWQREAALFGTRVEVEAARDLRRAAADVDQLLLQYGEFSERARPETVS